MTRKNITIRRGIVTEMMAALANLPKREKAPGDLLTLPEIFHSKEYIAEIKSVLNRGYSFGDLAKIISERCGVSISERQIKYHYTREMNLQGKKRPSVTKPKREASPNDTDQAAESNAFSHGMNLQSGANGA